MVVFNPGNLDHVDRVEGEARLSGEFPGLGAGVIALIEANERAHHDVLRLGVPTTTLPSFSAIAASAALRWEMGTMARRIFPP